MTAVCSSWDNIRYWKSIKSSFVSAAIKSPSKKLTELQTNRDGNSHPLITDFIMQPLKLLNNVQKARLLHSLLSEEGPGFLAYLKEMSEAVINGREELEKDWENLFFSVDFWIELAGQSQKVQAKYAKDLVKSASVFSDQLFDGYN